MGIVDHKKIRKAIKKNGFFEAIGSGGEIIKIGWTSPSMGGMMYTMGGSVIYPETNTACHDVTWFANGHPMGGHGGTPPHAPSVTNLPTKKTGRKKKKIKKKWLHRRIKKLEQSDYATNNILLGIHVRIKAIERSAKEEKFDSIFGSWKGDPPIDPKEFRSDVIGNIPYIAVAVGESTGNKELDETLEKVRRENKQT